MANPLERNIVSEPIVEELKKFNVVPVPIDTILYRGKCEPDKEYQDILAGIKETGQNKVPLTIRIIPKLKGSDRQKFQLILGIKSLIALKAEGKKVANCRVLLPSR